MLMYNVKRSCIQRDYFPIPYNDPDFKSDLVRYWPLDHYYRDLSSLRVEDNKFDFDLFKELWGQVDKTKSPGSPYKHCNYSENADLEMFTEELYEDWNSRLNGLRNLGEYLYDCFKNDKQKFNDLMAFREHSSHSKISQYLCDKGFVDPVLLNTKSEPRLLEKKRRLVCMISVLDNLVDRALLGYHLAEEQTKSYLTTATALDLTTVDKTNEMWEEFTRHSPIMSSDVQGWEWACRSELSFRSFMKYAYQQQLCTVDMVVNPERSYHFYALLARFFCIIHRVVQTKCGKLLTTPPGMVSSGLLATFSKNSFERASISRDFARSLGVTDPFIKTAGDDEVSNIIADQDYAERWYKLYGFVITDYQLQSDAFSFCSTTFKFNNTYQENIEKAFVNILFTSLNAVHYSQQLAGFAQAFKRHPKYNYYLEQLEINVPLQWQ